MDVKRVVNSIFQSNTYIFCNRDTCECILIDCGDVAGVMKILPSGANIVAVLLTHCHFDHIYGLNDLVARYPECRVYASEHAIKNLYDPKLNYSRYHEVFLVPGFSQAQIEGHPALGDFIFKGDNTVVLEPDTEFSPIEEMQVKAIHTPGHDAGCMSYIIGDCIFTGDSYIPGVKTITSLRGNRKQATESEEKIKALVAEQHLTTCPGHGEMKQYITDLD